MTYLGNINQQVHRLRASHIWDKEKLGFYVDPQWVSERLFEVEKFIGSIWDPCCGKEALDGYF